MSIQYTPNLMTGDNIAKLPVDNTPPNEAERQLVDALFEHKGTLDTIFENMKEVVLIGVLFIIVSLPQVVQLIQKYVPITNGSIYMQFGVQSLLLMFLFWFIKHFQLSRK